MASSFWPCQPVKPIGCDGEDCPSGLNTWPLHNVSDGSRLCSSCVLLSYRHLYCCSCFLLLGPEPPAPFDDGDRLLAPPGPTATCQVCRDAVAHLSCLQSAYGVFVCPACNAAAAGRPFSYAPACRMPLDVRGARVVLLAARMSLAVLRKEAAQLTAMAARLSMESAAELKQARRALCIAQGFDLELPSWNENALPLPAPPEFVSWSEKAPLFPPPAGFPSWNEKAPPFPSPELSSWNDYALLFPSPELLPCKDNALPLPPPQNPPPERNDDPADANMDMAALHGLNLNETPPPSPNALKIGAGVVREMAMAAAEAAKTSPPPQRTLQLLWEDKNPEDEDEQGFLGSRMKEMS